MAVDLSKVWGDEGSRAVEVMGGEPVKHFRSVEDKLRLEFTMDEWRRVFNVDSSYKPCDSNYKAYTDTVPVNIHFVRTVTEP